ncbi:hypothetical protein N7532_007568 [Penicillium argentinense]|uniref:Uncharacterized protein n=1 Tax=Penicillium argentinense TaxID=1131581 RepID=A0A9W9F7Y7_9EURO|nr:uncharacterized protein N7532_007568 [Penicillium argentinense]KAJ5095277.1 hypothetical protein N7532_007568 [Penicillium argentinense]
MPSLGTGEPIQSNKVVEQPTGRTSQHRCFRAGGGAVAACSAHVTSAAERSAEQAAGGGVSAMYV